MRFQAKFVSTMGAGLFSLTLMAAMSRAEEVPAPTETTPPTYQDVASIIANNCGYCHTGGADAMAGVSLDNEAEVVARAAQMYAAVSSGFMPYGDSEWRNTPDGIKLLAYLKSQMPAESEEEPDPTEAAPTLP
ncbi:hypothetical protein [Oligoflexus tunisiensis]|uniref:hypothetical protein n=1 Tax=Oligoflexus tunisiensis TaxID=708132 RepID=UPI00114CD573|nr:hypothetical protein [Oligoflexus tunisiensis]